MSGAERWGRILAAIIVVLSYSFAVTAAPAQASSAAAPNDPPMPTWTPMVADGPAYFTNMTGRALAYKSDGTPCAAFGGDDLYYACQIGGFWYFTMVDSSPKVGEYASLAFNQDDWPFISYYDSFDGELKLAYLPGGGSWVIQTVPAPLPPVALRLTPDQAVESSFWQMEKLRTAPPSSPTQIDVPAPEISFVSFGVGKFTSIAVDVRNWVYISYFSDYDGALWLCMFNGDPVNPWEFHKIDDYADQGRTGLWSSIAIEFRDNMNIFAHISYMDEKYDNLKYSYFKFSNRSHDNYTIDGPANVGSFTSIALLNGDTPVISYLEFINSGGNITGKLKFAKLLNLTINNWAVSVIDDTSPKTGWYSSIAVDPYGCGKRIHISYYNVYSGSLRYAVYQNNSWSRNTAADNVGLTGLFTSIAINPVTCLPGIAYLNALTGHMEFVTRTSLSSLKWASPPSIIAYLSRDVGIATSLALRSDNQVFVSYLDATLGELKNAWSLGTTMGTPIFSTAYTYPYNHAGPFTSSVRYTPDGTPRIAFYDQDNGDLMYGGQGTLGWWYMRVDRYYNVGQYPSLALDSVGEPHISYYDVTNGNLLYAYWNLGWSRWVTETVDVVGNVGEYSSLTLTSTNLPVISYYDNSNNSLKYAYKTPIGAWVDYTVDKPLDGSDVGMYSSIDLDNTNTPHISYYDKTNGDLKFASWNGASWDITVPEATTDNTGLYTSLKINKADNSRHLCFYDLTAGSLIYGRWMGTAWAFQTVDGDDASPNPFIRGDVGAYCSIDLDGSGNPGISYYDNSRGDLRVALTAPLPPPPVIPLYLPIVIHP